MTCLVFKATYIDRGNPLREGAFFFKRRILFPSLDKRNTHDQVKGLCIALERHIRVLGVRCLSTISRGGRALVNSLYIGSLAVLYRLLRTVGKEGSCLRVGGIAASLWRDRGVVHGVSCFFVSLCAVYQIVPSESMRIDRVLSPSTGRVVCALPVSHSYRVRPREDLSL